MNSSQKIPGYCGHVPHRSELIGLTTGQSNKVAEMAYREMKSPNKRLQSNGFDIINAGSLNSGAFSRAGSVSNANELLEKKAMVGTTSRNSKTWLNGPQHEIRNQHVPGYTGFIQGIKAENVYSKSYAKDTALSLKKEIPRGQELAPKLRYVSQSQSTYKPENFRRIRENKDMTNKRDFLEYTMQLN